MSYQLELRHFKYFLAVAEELHYRRAAEKLFISQPGLSKQIKQLEENLGVQLFERHNRKVALTKAGEYLKVEITKNLKNLDNILNHAKLINTGKDGNLKFGYVGSAMQDIIPNLLVRLNQQYPNITFGLKEMDNQSQLESLLSNKIDIGFVRVEKVPKSIERKTVLKESFCLVLPKNHQINSYNFKSLKEFQTESFILFDSKYSVSYYEKVMEIFQQYRFTPIVSHNTIHAESIYKLVENGFGISIVPKSLTKTNYTGIQFIELNRIPQRTTLSAVWSRENRNPVIQNAINLLHSF
ncbi:DNA-binding transcriptional regulator, LysR family [Tenacibaculum sp. MAR_2009_124]|uniref:LysR substrate-binding domain-containing protein n=1 Tax=Tenacibaculum sp. MAR_2009_124 TaxID=1250059 RepID=UPI000899F97C|nr:LysR substrate-binding domain-containing protein [Tenacibaculum sp. MAR_2009_124]SEB45250.1 DNA-binding transcriptional regulator, LysR family [Tenacibaculum sp. MAR_2009_124]